MYVPGQWRSFQSDAVDEKYADDDDDDSDKLFVIFNYFI